MASISVGYAMGAMYYTLCIHPPSIATALVAVIGGPNILALGYQYIPTPIGTNTSTILLVAFLFNALFHWRRYPAFVVSKEFGKDYNKIVYEPVDHADFVYALS